jgi:hypothetical protein
MRTGSFRNAAREENALASYGFVVPVKEGSVERNRAFAAELNGPRKAEFEASRRALGITSEQVWMQETPMGTMSVVYLEADDIMAALGGLGMSQDPFLVWWRAQILDIHGVDLSKPPSGPPNEQVMNYRG